MIIGPKLDRVNRPSDTQNSFDTRKESLETRSESIRSNQEAIDHMVTLLLIIAISHGRLLKSTGIYILFGTWSQTYT